MGQKDNESGTVMSTNYAKNVPFPEPFVPRGAGPGVPDPFGNLMRAADDQLPEMPMPGGGGAFPDLDIRRAVDGSVVATGTNTMTVGGKDIYWIQLNTNVNGTAGFMLVMGSLGYTTAL